MAEVLQIRASEEAQAKFKALAAELNMTDQAVQKRYVRALKAMKEYYGGK